MYLSIDPGISTGWAAWYFEPDTRRFRLHSCGRGEGWPYVQFLKALIERPQVYGASQSKGDPNDLITLAIRVGRYSERLEYLHGTHVDHVFPNAWKGQTPKEVTKRRVAKALQEMGQLADLSCHDVVDALGLGLYASRSGLWRP